MAISFAAGPHDILVQFGDLPALPDKADPENAAQLAVHPDRGANQRPAAGFAQNFRILRMVDVRNHQQLVVAESAVPFRELGVKRQSRIFFSEVTPSFNHSWQKRNSAPSRSNTPK